MANNVIADGIHMQNKSITSFLLIGQSNMAGRGEFSEVEEIDNNLCYMLRNGRWQKMSEPLNPDRAVFTQPYHSGVGLGASFADAYAKHFSAPIGLIPCADGGTSLSEWMPGEILFDHAVCMAKLAMRTSTLGGILWHQGENDCGCDEDVFAYREKFQKMIGALRKELHAERLPVLIGELSTEIDLSWGCADRPFKLNQEFCKIVKDNLPCALVPSSGLTLKEDGIHFNSLSYREFGKRYFQEYLKCVSDQTV